jgi:hypothetical protein
VDGLCLSARDFPGEEDLLIEFPVNVLFFPSTIASSAIKHLLAFTPDVAQHHLGAAADRSMRQLLGGNVAAEPDRLFKLVDLGVSCS